MSYYIRKQMQNRKAFTMVELVFVIVVIGILTAVAIPKLAATRDDAEISKARATVASVRNAIATERQKRILRGNFDGITDLGASGDVFDNFSAATDEATGQRVLEYPIASCATRGATTGCWTKTNNFTYQYTLPDSRTVNFTIGNAATPINRFDCTSSAALCRLLGS